MSFITGLLSPLQWTLIGIAAVALLFNHRAFLFGLMGKIKLPTTPGQAAPVKPGIPTRRQVLDYLDSSYAFFQDEGCKEGMAAVSEAVVHAFHEHDAAGNVIKPGVV